MNTVAEMSCRELVELVTDYLEGALTPSDRVRFDNHLAECPGCVDYVAQIRETVRLTGERLREETLVPAMRDTLLAHFRTWKHDRG